MAASQFSPTPNHDEGARQGFVLGFKTYLARDLTPGNKRAMESRVLPAFRKQVGRDPKDRTELRHAMEQDPYHQAWGSLMRVAQEQMWDSIEDSIDRQMPDLMARSVPKKPKGSLRLDPKFELPRYLAAVDHHGMPGSYHGDTQPGDIRAGAIFERSVNLYHIGNRGTLADVMGRTLAAVVHGEYPDLKPKRILDMGCTVGQSTVPLAEFFPKARIDAIDAGAPCLRYGHARAEAMGVAIHFSQQNAEKTDFPSGAFDLVVSHIMLHETSAKAVPQIFKESARILRKGGVMVHMDVPVRYRDLPLYDQVIRGWQTRYNDEPFWDGVCSADLEKAAKAAGFAEVRCGYVPKSDDPVRNPSRITQVPNQGPDWRFVVTARK